MSKNVKHTAAWVEKLKAALDYVQSDGIEEAHRATIKRALDSAYITATDDLADIEQSENEGKQWKAQEVAAIKSYLEDRDIARSYEQAMETIEIACERFRRSKKSIKRKALELGLADRVDWWLSKHAHRLKDDSED